jgi:hypothetical protein
MRDEIRQSEVPAKLRSGFRGFKQKCCFLPARYQWKLLEGQPDARCLLRQLLDAEPAGSHVINGREIAR